MSYFFPHDRYHLNGGETPLSEERVRFVVAEVATALDFLRVRGIVHRDVKVNYIITSVCKVIK